MDSQFSRLMESRLDRLALKSPSAKSLASPSGSPVQKGKRPQSSHGHRKRLTEKEAPGSIKALLASPLALAELAQTLVPPDGPLLTSRTGSARGRGSGGGVRPDDAAPAPAPSLTPRVFPATSPLRAAGFNSPRRLSGIGAQTPRQSPLGMPDRASSPTMLRPTTPDTSRARASSRDISHLQDL